MTNEYSADLTPILEAIADRAARLCESQDARIFVIEENALRYVAGFGEVPFLPVEPIRPLTRGLTSGRAVIDQTVIHVEDLAEASKEFPESREYQQRFGHRTTLSVPLLRGNKAIGVILLRRSEVRPFDAKHIELVKAFADQAAAAIENLQLSTELKTRNAELKESLERQTATAEILRVISSSPSDIQPVLDAVARTAARLCGASDVIIRRVDGSVLRIAAHFGPVPIVREAVPISRGTFGGRAVIERRTVHVHDFADEQERAEYPEAPIAQQHGETYRTVLATPLLHEGAAIGTIAIRRPEPQPFSDQQVKLLETFAAQAVIAIENVRLFNETREALEQQTVIGEILRVISSSPTDTQPVFDAIVKSGLHLFGGMNISLFIAKGDHIETVASTLSLEEAGGVFSQPIGDPSRVSPRAMLCREVVQVPDMRAPEEWVNPDNRKRAEQRGWRAIMSAPLIRQDEAIGTIVVTRATPGVFSEKQVALLKTFADQAVIAIENVRLFNETKEALEQQTATADILRVISSSPTDVQPVFDAIVKCGVHLLGGLDVSLRLVKGDHNEVVASSLPIPIGGNPSPLNDDRFVSSRSILRREVVQVPDVLADEEFGERLKRRAEQIGVRAIVCAPMLRESIAIGTINVTRATPGQFTEKEIALLKTFADQAVIAIENVRLFKELQARNAEITESLEQQTATSEVLRVIASTPTRLEPVLETLITSAVKLAGASQGYIRQFDGEALNVAAHYGETTEQMAILRNAPLRPDPESTTGRAFAEKRPIHTLDAQAGRPGSRAVQMGVRTLLAVPLLREGTAIGVISIWRSFIEPFTDKQIALLQTFADQAVIAIENVRLFKELQARNAQISESLEQQTATAEVLREISRSPADLQPVYSTILESINRLCEANIAALWLYDGEVLSNAASNGTTPEFAEHIRAARPRPSRQTTTRLAALERQVVHVVDLLGDPAFAPEPRDLYERENVRTVLSVPMKREEKLVGVITVWRREVRPFTNRQIHLVETFADQAVIAIENVRLFNETKEALEQQTVISEILRVISSSPTDVQPVFDTIVKSGLRLFGSSTVSLRLVRGDQTEMVASTLPLPEFSAAPLNDDGVPTSRAILRREVVNVADIPTTDWVAEGTKRRAASRGTRALVAAPLVREKNAIGAISVSRTTPGLFTDKQVALLRTFADQAVIAIENVRLFKELQARNAEVTEALEQQTATAEILKVISSSPTDTQPVFDAIVTSGLRLFGSMIVSLRIVKGDHSELAASTDSTTANSISLSEVDSPTTRAIRRREVVQVPDMLAEEWVPERSKQRAKLRGFRAIVSAPLLREDSAIGVINVLRASPGPFTDKEVALLKTFASQAVIAIENVRLFNETKEALEQQTVISEILRVISSSPTDTRPVFDAIVKSGVHLFDGLDVSLLLVNGDRVQRVASTVPLDAQTDLPFALKDDHFVSSRSILRREVLHIPDIFSEDWVGETSKQRASRRGTRAILCAPMLRENNAVGAIVVTRAMPGPFTDKQIALLRTFADQAVIAIENVRLFKELQARNAEITESLEQQTATAEILQVISSSPTDLQPVFNAILENAMRLCDGNVAAVGLYDGKKYQHVAQRGAAPEHARYLFRGPFDPDSAPILIGPMVRERRPIHVPDIRATPGYRDRAPVVMATYDFGARSCLSIPMMKEDRVVGGIFIFRPEARPFTQKQIDLVSTFANQAVIAIENARLFNEINEALQRQTSIAEILRVISSTPTDIMPVLEAVTHRAAQLCDAQDARLFLVEGDILRNVAGFGEFSGVIPILPLTRGVVVGRAIIDQSVIHIEDLAAAFDEFPEAREPQQQFGHRTTLAVPLVRENKAFGGILIRRKEVRPFSEKQIELVKTFADQATIAIENVRLFNEIREKGQQLEAANKHKSEFLANMSHELRTPLNAVIGFSEALIEKMFGELNPKQEDYLRDIHSSGRHLLSLINDILDLSKIEAGRMELELSDFSVPMALKNAIALVRGRAQTHGIALKLRVDPKLGDIRADERKFKQIVVNLLSNAVKFTPDGGHVEVNARRNGGAVKVSVKDNGIGIASKDQAALFEAFRQVGSDYTTKREGTGLGLALTRRFVELHGGKILLKSKPGKGSTFTFTLPLSGNSGL